MPKDGRYSARAKNGFSAHVLEERNPQKRDCMDAEDKATQDDYTDVIGRTTQETKWSSCRGCCAAEIKGAVLARIANFF